MPLCRVPGCDHDPDSNCVNRGLWGNQGTLPEGYHNMPRPNEPEVPPELLGDIQYIPLTDPPSIFDYTRAVEKLTGFGPAYVGGDPVASGIDANPNQIRIAFGGIENREALK